MVLTQMFCGDILQSCTPHRSGAEYDLARPRIEGLEELNQLAHCVHGQQGQVDDDFEVVGEDSEHR